MRKTYLAAFLTLAVIQAVSIDMPTKWAFSSPLIEAIIEYSEMRFVASASGKVQDPSGSYLPDVQVDLLYPEADLRFPEEEYRLLTVTTDSKGKFKFPKQKSGTQFMLRFSLDGFNTVIIHITIDPKVEKDIGVLELPVS